MSSAGSAPRAGGLSPACLPAPGPHLLRVDMSLAPVPDGDLVPLPVHRPGGSGFGAVRVFFAEWVHGLARLDDGHSRAAHRARCCGGDDRVRAARRGERDDLVAWADAAGLEPVDGDSGLLSQAHGLRGAGTAVTDERQAHVRAEGNHVSVAAHARIPPGPPIGGVTFDQAAMGPPDAFGDLVSAARAGSGDQQGVAVMPVPSCCPALKIPMRAALGLPMWGCGKAPRPGWLRGLGGDGAGGCG